MESERSGQVHADLIEGLPKRMGKGRWRWTAIAILAAVMAVTAGLQAYFYKQLSVPGEGIGSVPDGNISDLRWHGGYLYFFREPPWIDSVRELWRVVPGRAAEEIKLADSGCEVDYYQAISEWPDGNLVLARVCNATSIEIAKVHPETGSTERIALVQYGPPMISGIDRVADTVFVAQDGAQCTGIARFDGEVFVPVPLLKTKTESLDLGKAFEERDECTGSPAGFVTPFGGEIALLASPEAAGLPADKRYDLDWSIYLAGADWSSGERLTDGFEDPAQMASFGDCGLLVAAVRDGSPGIWFVDRRGHTERLLKGDIADFAVRPDGEAIAVLGRDADTGSFHIVRRPFKGKSTCKPGARF